jgi:methionine synthase II (cobalamin-independent)
MNNFKPQAKATLIGSLPISDHDEALRIVMESTPDIPLWVQLPVHSQEGMLTQFVSGLPGLVISDNRVILDASLSDFDRELLDFYEEYIAVTQGTKSLDASRFVLTKESAPGFFVLQEALKTVSKPFAIKGQITGPVTLSLGITDHNKQAAFYDERLRDAITKIIALKARWQVEQLKQFGVPVIIFLDEPALAGFGSSALIGVSKEDVEKLLAEVIDQIHQSGGLAGVHVCANTDWTLILESSADILSFDAYDYFDRLILYAKELKKFLEQDKILAWGIVPTAKEEDIEKETADSLVARWEEEASELETLGISQAQILSQSLITPSCGTGSMSLDHALKVLKLNLEVSGSLQRLL